MRRSTVLSLPPQLAFPGFNYTLFALIVSTSIGPDSYYENGTDYFSLDH
jgi:hypothetical protein